MDSKGNGLHFVNNKQFGIFLFTNIEHFQTTAGYMMELITGKKKSNENGGEEN